VFNSPIRAGPAVYQAIPFFLCSRRAGAIRLPDEPGVQPGSGVTNTGQTLATPRADISLLGH